MSSKKDIFNSTQGLDKHHRFGRHVDDYKTYSLAEQIYFRPDTYLGSEVKNEREEYLFDFESKQMVLRTIELPEAIERIFLEILSNAGDNADTSRRNGIPPGKIIVEMDKTWCRVRSEGMPIPIQTIESPKEDCRTIIDQIFGVLLTSSNYDNDVILMGCGRNGYGAKLCNIFSDEFIVKVGDPQHGQTQTTSWSQNMEKRTSEIKPGFRYIRGKWLPVQSYPYKGEAYVEISWKLDFNRFGYQEYPDEAMHLFAKHLINFSLTCKILVVFNQIQFDYRLIDRYSQLYFEKEEKIPSVLDRYWEKGMPECLQKADLYGREILLSRCPVIACLPDVEWMAFDTPDDGHFIAYVNGMITKDGGEHVQAVYEAILHFLKQERRLNIQLKDLTPHITIILSCRLPNPVFTSQSKSKLKAPSLKIQLTESLKNDISSWSLIDRLVAHINAKLARLFSKTDGKKSRFVMGGGGEDAHLAGSKDMMDCTLYLVEGESAAAYIRQRLSLIPNGHDYGGYLPLQGKVINVLNADFDQLCHNPDLIMIKKYMGFKTNNDYSSLRYGRLVIVTDADPDGQHIRALICNLLWQIAPEFLKEGYVSYLQTPVVRVGQKRFFTMAEYEKDQDKSTDVRYFKGLGSSNQDDIKDDIEHAPMIVLYDDDETEKAIQLTFNSALSDQRKEWLELYFEGKIDAMTLQPSVTGHQAISCLILSSLIDYSILSLFRAIPNCYDGLKQVQRQILDYLFQFYDYGRSKKPSEIVSRLASGAAMMQHYHHGETSIIQAFFGLARSYVGSNNLCVLHPDGQFGTRLTGGLDAAAGRYPKTKLSEWIPTVYNADLIEMLPKRKSDGHEVERILLVADLPMHLVNGCHGIATGYSTFIPPYHPQELRSILMNRLQSPTQTDFTDLKIMPYYHGFKGSIEVKGQSLITTGCYEIKNHEIHITELPIGVWTKTYREELEKWYQSKIITKLEDYSTVNEPYFIISGYQSSISHESLKLVKTYGLGNMVLINEHGHPKRYESVADILEVYYQKMLLLYEEYRLQKIKTLTAEYTTSLETFEYLSKIVQSNQENLFERLDLEKARSLLLIDGTAKERKKRFQHLEFCQVQIHQFKTTTAKQLWLDRLKVMFE